MLANTGPDAHLYPAWAPYGLFVALDGGKERTTIACQIRLGACFMEFQTTEGRLVWSAR